MRQSNETTSQTVTRRNNETMSQTVTGRNSKTTSQTVTRRISENDGQTVTRRNSENDGQPVTRRNSENDGQTVTRRNSENIGQTVMRLNNETTECTNVNRQLEIDNFETEILNIDCTNNETIEFNWDKSTTYQIQCRFLKIIENSYVKATRPEKPMIRAEMKLCLDNAKSFSCSPRRLSYTEKDKL